MSNPEISRRCAACGATIRHRAMFCPQCGSEVINNDEPEKHGNDPEAAISNLADTIVEKRESRTSFDAVPPTKFDPSMTQPLSPALPPTRPLKGTSVPVDEKAQTIALSGIELPKPPRLEKRPAQAGKLKRVSTVILDQAAYDPSARFLLVAAGLLVVFAILLILSRILS